MFIARKFLQLGLDKEIQVQLFMQPINGLIAMSFSLLAAQPFLKKNLKESHITFYCLLLHNLLAPIQHI